MFKKLELPNVCIPGNSIAVSYENLIHQLSAPNALASKHVEIKSHSRFGKYYGNGCSSSCTPSQVIHAMFNQAEKSKVISPKNTNEIKSLVADVFNCHSDIVTQV